MDLQAFKDQIKDLRGDQIAELLLSLDPGEEEFSSLVHMNHGSLYVGFHRLPWSEELAVRFRPDPCLRIVSEEGDGTQYLSRAPYVWSLEIHDLLAPLGSLRTLLESFTQVKRLAYRGDRSTEVLRYASPEVEFFELKVASGADLRFTEEKEKLMSRFSNLRFFSTESTIADASFLKGHPRLEMWTNAHRRLYPKHCPSSLEASYSRSFSEWMGAVCKFERELQRRWRVAHE